MCKVSVIIPNYNGRQFLEECLGALREQTFQDFEVILVDNGSQDDSLKLLARVYPEAKSLRLDRNYGFCRAVNEGIRASGAEYVILLNNDTRVHPDFIRYLTEAMDQHPNCFSCASHMYQMHDPSKTDDAGNFFSAMGWAYARGKDKPVQRYQKPARIFAACAGAAIYRRALVERLGMLDEAHFAYLEDVDLGYRARIEGYVNLFEPRAKVLHVGSGTTGARHNAFKVQYSARNNLYLIYKNMPIPQLILNAPLLFLGTLIKMVFFTSKGFGKEYREGLSMGVALAKNGKKYPFRWKNIGNYCRIQGELWVNIFRRFE